MSKVDKVAENNWYVLSEEAVKIKNPCDSCISFRDCKITGDVGTTCTREAVYKAQMSILRSAKEINLRKLSATLLTSISTIYPDRDLTLSDIEQIIAQYLEPEKPKCPECGGTGHVTILDGRSGMEYSEPCNCQKDRRQVTE